MRDLIRRRVPRATASSARNTAATDLDAELVWVLDPIDGTKSFITGRPLFGTLIALLPGGGPVLGIIDQSILRRALAGRRRRAVDPQRPADRRAPLRRAGAGGAVRHQPAHVRRRRAARGLSAGRGPGPAADVRRRLLRLRAAGDGLCRPRRRGRPRALRLHGAGPGDRGRRRPADRLGRAAADPGFRRRGDRRRRRRAPTRRRASLLNLSAERHMPKLHRRRRSGCQAIAAAQPIAWKGSRMLLSPSPAPRRRRRCGRPCRALAAGAGRRAAHGHRRCTAISNTPPGFTHFDYVDPNAPKGGSMALSAVGTFDSINPFILRGTPAPGSALVVRDADHAVAGRAVLRVRADRPDHRGRPTIARWVSTSCILRRAGTTASRSRPRTSSSASRP